MRAAAAAVFVLCVATSSNAGEIILVNDSPAVAGCERLGEVRSGSLWGGLMAGAAYDGSLKKLKARAAKMGATHLLLLNVASGFSGAQMLGQAYRCDSTRTNAGAGNG